LIDRDCELQILTKAIGVRLEGEPMPDHMHQQLVQMVQQAVSEQALIQEQYDELVETAETSLISQSRGRLMEIHENLCQYRRDMEKSSKGQPWLDPKEAAIVSYNATMIHRAEGNRKMIIALLDAEDTE